MITCGMRQQLALLIFTLLLIGCSRDTETLDRFSHAYTAFLSAEYDVFIASYVPVVNPEEKPGNYWTELKGALDTRATNVARVEHARNAIEVDRVFLTNAMGSLSLDVEQLDNAVLRLVETANTILDRQHRFDAVEVSKSAREIQSAYDLLRTLYLEDFRLKRRALDRIVEYGGALQPWASSMARDSLRFREIDAEKEKAKQQISTAMKKLKDGFSALKGKSGLKTYPSKRDDAEGNSATK